MKAAFFTSVFYMGQAPGGWPTPANSYSPVDARDSMETALAQYRLADEMGFDWVTLAEHHFGPVGLTPNPMVMAGALSEVVKRAKIALLGPTIPMLNPVRLAEEIAMLDTLTGGRIIVGMMRGTPNEYVTYNTNPAESRGRFEEALQLVRMAWTEAQPFAWQGRYFQYRSICIWPRPVQAPHPPMYMSGSSSESALFAARNRVSLGLAVTTVPLAAKAVGIFRDEARANGWEPQADDVLYRLSFHVADTDDQAIADLEESRKYPQRLSPIALNPELEATVATTGYYGSDATKQRARDSRAAGVDARVELGTLLIGSPDTVVKQVERIAAQLNPGVLDLVPAFQVKGRTAHSIKLFGEQVLPRIRAL